MIKRAPKIIHYIGLIAVLILFLALPLESTILVATTLYYKQRSEA